MTSTTWPPAVAAFRVALTDHPDITQHVGTIVTAERDTLAAGGESKRLHDIAAQLILRPYRRRREWLELRESRIIPLGLALLLLSRLIHALAPPSDIVNTIVNGLAILAVCQIAVAAVMFAVAVLAAPVRPRDGLALVDAYMLLMVGDDRLAGNRERAERDNIDRPDCEDAAE